MIRFSGIGSTHVGRRRIHNEDCFVADPSIGLYMVCDGLGGHARGEIASHEAARRVHEALREVTASYGELLKLFEDDVLMTHVATALAAASESVNRHGMNDDRCRGMATTVTLLWVVADRVVMGHVGDSRLYRWRRGQVRRLSQDHTVAEELWAEGIILGPESRYDNLLTQAVGQRAPVVPQLRVIHPRDGDVFLLCTDGLSDALNIDVELAGMFEWATPEELPRLLIDAANGRGGRDNITALLVHPVGVTATSAAQIHRSA